MAKKKGLEGGEEEEGTMKLEEDFGCCGSRKKEGSGKTRELLVVVCD